MAGGVSGEQTGRKGEDKAERRKMLGERRRKERESASVRGRGEEWGNGEKER